LDSQARAGADAAGVREICLQQGVPVVLYDSFDNLQQEVLATNVGNPALEPETADTYTAGVLFRSTADSPWLRDLTLSIDYYDITLEGAISTITAPQSIPKCFNRDGSNPTLDPANFFCRQIARHPLTGAILDVSQPTLNIGAYQTNGVDFALQWQVGVDAIGLHAPAVLRLRSHVSYLDSFQVQTTINGPFAEYAGTVGSPTASAPGSLPEWKGVTDLQLDADRYGAGVRWRFIDSMLDSSLATNPASTSPGVDAYHLFDVFGHWDVSEALRLTGGVNNVEDREPPIVRGIPGNTETSTYDIFGRSYYLALSARF
jgi:outer membrane receptor protein involved in Fe transport